MRDALRVFVAHRDFALEHVDQVGPVLLQRVDVAERVERFGIFAEQIEHAAQAASTARSRSSSLVHASIAMRPRISACAESPTTTSSSFS